MEHGEHLAAIDLGSNSFHMVVARQVHGEVQILDGLSEKVQLGAGPRSKGQSTQSSRPR